MNAVLSLALLLATAQVAGGQVEEIKKALATCAALDIETARLDCFEQLARAVAQIPLQAPKPPAPPRAKFKGSAGPGKWDVGVATDPIDDSRIVALALVDETDSLQLVLRCKQGKLDVWVTLEEYLGGEWTRVQTRIGSAKAEAKRWPIAMNHNAVYPGEAGVFIKALLSAPRLVVQVERPDEIPITGVFKLDGLPAVVAPLKETCRLP